MSDRNLSNLKAISSAIPISVAPIALINAWSNYLIEDIGRGAASEDTIRTYTSQIKLFLQWCSKNAIAPLSVSRSDVKAYRRALQEQKLKVSTIALKLSVVRRLYDGAIEAGLIVSNPALGIKPPYSSNSLFCFLIFLFKAASLGDTLVLEPEVIRLRMSLLIVLYSAQKIYLLPSQNFYRIGYLFDLIG